MKQFRLGQGVVSTPVDTNDKDMVAVTLKDLLRLQQGDTSGVSGACCCKQFVEISAPTQSEGFRFVGSMFQLASQLSESYVFTVPGGMDGVINRIGVYEIMPGVMSAVRVSLMINGEFNSQFPRMAGNIGNGAEAPLNVNIYLKQNDLVSILMDCPLTPFAIEGVAGEGFLEYGIVFLISGYYINSGYFSALDSIPDSGGVCQ